MKLRLDNLDISSIDLLPGHVFIRTIADTEITAPKNASSSMAVGALVHVHIKGIQLQLSQISFKYQDLTSVTGLKETTGFAEVTLPPEGVDLDVKVRLISNSAAGLAERDQKKRFTEVEHVGVSFSDDATVKVTKSNHPFLLAMFPSLVKARLRSGLENTLNMYIRSALEGIDAVVWDTTERAVVFQDAGLERGPALAAAWWSELGRLRRMHGGISDGWRATRTGVVREADGKAEIAIGAEPQVVGAEKNGSKDAPPDVEGAAKHVVGKAKEGVQEGLEKVLTFEEMISEKRQKEESRAGWRSAAFDL